MKNEPQIISATLTRNAVGRLKPTREFESLPLRQKQADANGRLLCFSSRGFERVGSEWAAGGRSEPTLTEPAGESESLPLRHKKSTAVLIELRWIFSMTENRLK